MDHWFTLNTSVQNTGDNDITIIENLFVCQKNYNWKNVEMICLSSISNQTKQMPVMSTTTTTTETENVHHIFKCLFVQFYSSKMKWKFFNFIINVTHLFPHHHWQFVQWLMMANTKLMSGEREGKKYQWCFSSRIDNGNKSLKKHVNVYRRCKHTNEIFHWCEFQFIRIEKNFDTFW